MSKQKEEVLKFARIWQESASLEEVAQKTGLGKRELSTKVRALRKKGLNLKSMQKGVRQLTEKDIVEINNLIA